MRLRRYHLIQLPIWSFFSKRLYRDVALHWNGGNFAYLFLLIAFCCLPATLELNDAALEGTAVIRNEWLDQLPPLEIRDGRVRLDQQKPLYLTNQKGTPRAVIDTTGSMNYIASPKINLLLTESKLIIRGGLLSPFTSIDLSDVDHLTITTSKAERWLNQLDRTVMPLIFGLLLFFAYLSTVAAVLVLALAGRIIAAVIHCGLRTSQVIRITTVAATPTLMMLTAAFILHVQLPLSTGAVITAVYMLAALFACKGSNEIPVNLKAHLNRKASAKRAA